MRTTRIIISQAAALVACCASVQAQFVQQNLVSNETGQATFTDPTLLNPGGFASGPTGPMFFTSGSSGTGIFFDGTGTSFSPVTIPSLTPGGTGAPTSTVFNPNMGFTFMNGGVSAPAQFIFATSDGSLAAFNPTVGTGAPNSTEAFTVFDNSSKNSNFTGLEFITLPSMEDRLLAADFRRQRITAFADDFTPVNAPGSFVDPTLPSDYSPFNVQSIGNEVFVTYARPDATGDAPITGAGEGIVSVFNSEGQFQRRFATGGSLDAPSAVAVAPSDFGAFSNSILIANAGSGMINAFDPVTGDMLGVLSDASDDPIIIPGIRDISFGNGSPNQPAGSLFFSAGIGGDTPSGLVGTIVIPAPSAAPALALMALLSRRPRRDA